MCYNRVIDKQKGMPVIHSKAGSGNMAVIVVSGMIGSGKSTLTELVSRHLETKPFYEPVTDNPVLPMYYKDAKRYGFLLQTFFLNRRFKMIKDALRQKNNVLDRSIYEDALFTKINFESGNIEEEEYKVYLDLVDNMMEELAELPKKSPDLLLHVDADFDTILNRIEKRGRSFEQITNDEEGRELHDYYKRVWSAYPGWFDNYEESEKISLDMTKNDLSTDEGKANILTMIDNKLLELGLIDEKQLETLKVKVLNKEW